MKKININEVLYNSAKETELNWRQNATIKDIELADSLLLKIQELGYSEVQYIVDLTKRKIHDFAILDTILETISKWDNKGIEASLIGVLGCKNYTKATQTIIKAYKNLSEKEQRQSQAYYDNALSKIADKSFLEQYILWASSWREVANFPLLMEKVCGWGIIEVRDALLLQLFSKEDYELYDPINFWTQRNQAYINSIGALAKFPNYDANIISALKCLFKETDCQVIKECIMREIKKLDKKKF